MRTRTKVVLGGLAAGTILAGVAGSAATVLAGGLLLRRLFRGRHAALRFALLRAIPRDHGLAGRTVLVTGSSRGLGLAVAEQFAREGCKLVLCARNEHELARARQRVERSGAEVCAVV